MLIAPTSTDTAPEALPTRVPILSVKCRLPLPPCASRHRSEVSEDHFVSSHTESLSRMAGDSDTEAKLAPCTVTRIWPVDNPLARLTWLKVALSKDMPSLPLPVLLAETDIRRLPIAPCPVWHRVDVSDAQAVRSHPVSPTCSAAVYVAAPMLAPCTVMLAEPVVAAFFLCIKLTPPTSVLYPSDRLPTSNPVVITIRALPCCSCPAKHRIDVSAPHDVRSHAVRLTAIDGV